VLPSRDLVIAPVRSGTDHPRERIAELIARTEAYCVVLRRRPAIGPAQSMA
jgi:hypothetical protein